MASEMAWGWRGSSWIALAVVGLGLAGCSDSGVKVQSGPSASSAAATAAPTPTVDPRVEAALSAYASHVKTVYAAERRPVAVGKKRPEGADFTKFTFDPIRTDYESYIDNMVQQGVEYRGSTPVSHAKVKSVDLKASPWPSVTLTDCQTGVEDLKFIETKSGAVAPTVVPKVPLPYRATVKMIFFEKHWGVYAYKLDETKTCTP